MSLRQKTTFTSAVKRYLLTGALTIIPIGITFFIVKFLLDIILNVGQPIVKASAVIIHPYFPGLSQWLLQPWFGTTIAIILVVFFLFVLGFIATRVIGKRLISWFDRLMDQIPFVKTIYGASKKLILSLERKPDGIQRVVLIEFPHKEMKVVGFVTRTFEDETTGRKLAAVYVPTTPNPTSGYLEIVPIEKLVSTNWSVDEAMTFIVSGGAVAPDKIFYEKSAKLNIKKM
ncbi:DUF502 domain-containing protein [candidate division KSB1 bacterium]|nr:DUF502 domain-containing protein [candidate division KSB1 bacterium]